MSISSAPSAAAAEAAAEAAAAASAVVVVVVAALEDGDVRDVIGSSGEGVIGGEGVARAERAARWCEGTARQRRSRKSGNGLV